MTQHPQSTRAWDTRHTEKQRRIESVRAVAQGKVLPTDQIIPILETLIAPGDRVVMEGNNHKHAERQPR